MVNRRTNYNINKQLPRKIEEATVGGDIVHRVRYVHLVQTHHIAKEKKVKQARAGVHRENYVDQQG